MLTIRQHREEQEQVVQELLLSYPTEPKIRLAQHPLLWFKHQSESVLDQQYAQLIKAVAEFIYQFYPGEWGDSKGAK